MPKRQNPENLKLDERSSRADVFFEAFTQARTHGEFTGSTILDEGRERVFAQDHLLFHFVDAVPCEFRFGRGRSVVANPGDLVMFPRGTRHRVQGLTTSDGDRSAASTPAALATGAMHFEAAGGLSLMRALPEVIHVEASVSDANDAANSAAWLAITFEAMRKESTAPSIGSKVMLSRLVDMVFIWAVRHWLASGFPDERGWVAGLRDPVVADALALMHGNPDRDWSVDELAALLHQSRSNLAQRFVDLVGEPPMRYLTRWRLTLAANLLLTSISGITKIARQVGYDSESSFGRSFKRQFGVTPRNYRTSRGAN